MGGKPGYGAATSFPFRGWGVVSSRRFGCGCCRCLRLGRLCIRDPGNRSYENLVVWIDPVWIDDVFVLLPNLWPEPTVLQNFLRNCPQSVPADYNAKFEVLRVFGIRVGAEVAVGKLGQVLGGRSLSRCRCGGSRSLFLSGWSLFLSKSRDCKQKRHK